MNRLTIVRAAVVAAGLVAMSAVAFAQNTPFEPTVGQGGKDVVWVPTPDTLVEKMLDLAKVTPADSLIDLGSGDGKTVIAAAKRGVKAKGIEYNPDMVALSQRRAREAASRSSGATSITSTPCSRSVFPTSTSPRPSRGSRRRARTR